MSVTFTLAVRPPDAPLRRFYCADNQSYWVREDGVIQTMAGYVLKQCSRSRKSRYLVVSLKYPDRKRLKYVHQLVARCFIGPPPTPEHDVAHDDGKTHNNHFRNLRWATPLENSADQLIHGTRMRGVMHHTAKLSNEDIPVIRQLLAEGTKADIIAARYGVTKENISAIKRGLTWRHIT